jgi:hypothetical protein
MKEAKRVAYSNFEQRCKTAKVPPFFITVFMRVLRAAHEGNTPLSDDLEAPRMPPLEEESDLSNDDPMAPPPSGLHSPQEQRGTMSNITQEPAEVASVREDQASIGLHNMAVGFLANSWTTLLQSLGVNHPASMMETILSALWDEICIPIWMERNNIKHSRDSRLTEREMSDLHDRLLWYLRHHEEVLDYRHWILADFSPEDVRSWSRASRRAKLEALDNARDYYEVECQQKARNQTTIITWLQHQSKELRSGRIVGEGLRNAWAYGRHPTKSANISDPESTDEETEEEEFTWDQSDSSTQSNHSS